MPRYAQAALEAEVAAAREATEGARNETLNTSAFSLGQLVGGGILTRQLIETDLLRASEDNGLVTDDGLDSVEATIRSGLDAGILEPRTIPTDGGRSESSGKRPVIEITTEVQEVVDAALDALAINAPGKIYVKAGILVRVTRHFKKKKGYTRAPDAPLISPLPDPRLYELMALSAKWVKFSRDDWVPSLPPRWAVDVLAARGRWTFPYIETVVETPTLRPDGTILQEPGYDEASASLYVPNADFPRIFDKPTREDANRAVAELFEPFAEFPFKSLADGSVLLACILTTLARPAIEGPTPMFVFRKNAPGVGGSLAADAVSVIATGRTASRMTLTPDSRELRKLILTLAIEGSQLVLFDNLEGAIGSPILAAAITSETWADRLLGVSKVVRAPLRPTWIATGNGLTFNRDLGRRVMLSDMVSDLEHPEDRSDFRHKDLIAYVSKSRPRLVAAGLTILRAYCLAGCPKHGKPSKGSFVPWDNLVRGALVWANADDPVETTRRLRAEADTDLEGLRSALRIWREMFHEPITVAKAIEVARDRNSELLDSLATLCDCSTDRLDSSRLGYALRKYRERVVEGFRFTKPHDDGSKVGLWTVERV
ncbi:MAG: hypothetical protein GY725_00495 [bacterium]|nr:hypothetical protein [bacterium]